MPVQEVKLPNAANSVNNYIYNKVNQRKMMWRYKYIMTAQPLVKIKVHTALDYTARGDPIIYVHQMDLRDAAACVDDIIMISFSYSVPYDAELTLNNFVLQVIFTPFNVVLWWF